MLKVKNEKGKFDIVLSEATLFDAEAKDIAFKRKQNAKGFSSKTSKGWSFQAKTSKKQVTTINHSKKDDRTKSLQTGQQQKSNTDVTSLGKKTPPSRKELPSTKDAGYLTKDQLSRILSSLDSHVDIPAAGLQGSMKSEAQETFVYQSLAINNKKSCSTAHAPDARVTAANTEQSKEIEFKEYSPWDRPGGGAPIRTQSGNVVADYKKMNQNEVDAMPLIQTPNIRPKMMTTGQASNAHYSCSTEVPAAMRSSFAVGAPGTVLYETNQSRAEEKKKWLQDLEKQIKENKEKEAQEKLQRSLKESKHETWYQTPVPPHESSASITVPASSTLSTKQQNVQASVAPVIGGRAGNVHARGHGLQSLGQVNQDELERKRLKTLEHQLAIKEQVEEKRRIKQEEKERKMKDEAEKERTLAEEQSRLQSQYQEELKMRHQKEEEARRRAEALQVSVLQANQLALQEKAAKRIKQLESGGHDVSGLRSRIEINRDSVQQETALGQQVSSFYVTEDHQSSPRIEQVGTTLPKLEDDSRASSFQKNASLESELKEVSSTALLESQWTPSSPVSSQRNDSRVKAHSHSSLLSRKAAGQSDATARSQSQKSLRKKQPHKLPMRKRTSLENVTQDLESNFPPPPLEDAFMLPYRRTSSATFPVALDTDQDATVKKSKPTLKKADQAAQKKHNGGAKVAEVTRSGISSKVVDKRKPVKQDKANLTDGQLLLHLVQVSPDPLPTARQEMILQQLATLRQGLMMKERELHYDAL